MICNFVIFSESVGSGASLSAEPRDSSGQNPQDPCLADFFVSCAVVFFLFQERAGPHGGLPSIRRPRKAASAVRTNSERYDVAGGSPSRSGGRASGLRSSIDVVEGRRQFAAPRARTPHGPRAAGGTDNRKLRRMQARTLRGAQREAVASERNDFAPAGKVRQGRFHVCGAWAQRIRRRNSAQTMPVAIATLSDSEPRRSAGQGGMKSLRVTVRATSAPTPRPSLPMTTIPAGESSAP